MFGQLVLIKALCSVEILVSTALFARGLKKRRFWWLSLIAVSIAMACWAIFIKPIPGEGIWVSLSGGMLMFLPLWLFSVIGLFFAFYASPYGIIMIAIAGYTTQKIGSLVETFVALINPKELGFIMQENIRFLPILVLVISDAVTYTICSIIFAKRLRKTISSGKPKPARFALVVAATFANLLFGLMYTSGIEAGSSAVDPTSPVLIVGYLQNFLCCVLILCVLSGFFSTDAAEKELEQSKMVYAISRANYKNEKAVSEIINKKVHDLKHRVLEIAQNNHVDFTDIDEVVNIYDSSIHTNSEALDIVIQQKQLICQTQQIQLDMMCNAEKLSFMKNTDIFVLFGNLFDNAIQALCKLEDTNRRILNVRIYEKAGMLIIGFENEYDGEVLLEHGEYKTTKSNKENHGYGIRSIKEIVEKYQGGIQITSDDHVFKTAISFVLH